LQITNYKLQITNFKLQIANYKLQITNYKLQITNYKLQITIRRDGNKLRVRKYSLPAWSTVSLPNNIGETLTSGINKYTNLR